MTQCWLCVLLLARSARQSLMRLQQSLLWPMAVVAKPVAVAKTISSASLTRPRWWQRRQRRQGIHHRRVHLRLWPSLPHPRLLKKRMRPQQSLPRPGLSQRQMVLSSTWNCGRDCQNRDGQPGPLLQGACQQLWQGDGRGRGGAPPQGADYGCGEGGDGDCCNMGDGQDWLLPWRLPPLPHGEACHTLRRSVGIGASCPCF